ncbi:hypothetical protein Dsin_025678 [Dipteronia sinensis]|uniref:Uncharacterized protein n=1 Tax=Dipteronia sinensis TaxID=43782 RepID=A0AAD9ZXV7_9ROSI|nr:hypothetical protein Dsin_025678 [Dipteronia sinensis]
MSDLHSQSEEMDVEITRRIHICSYQTRSTSISCAKVGNRLDESRSSLVAEEFHADNADLLLRGDLPTLSRRATAGGV